jgi:hypothetical protein
MNWFHHPGSDLLMSHINFGLLEQPTQQLHPNLDAID